MAPITVISPSFTWPFAPSGKNGWNTCSPNDFRYFSWPWLGERFIGKREVGEAGLPKQVQALGEKGREFFHEDSSGRLADRLKSKQLHYTHAGGLNARTQMHPRTGMAADDKTTVADCWRCAVSLSDSNHDNYRASGH